MQLQLQRDVRGNFSSFQTFVNTFFTFYKKIKSKAVFLNKPCVLCYFLSDCTCTVNFNTEIQSHVYLLDLFGYVHIANLSARFIDSALIYCSYLIIFLFVRLFIYLNMAYVFCKHGGHLSRIGRHVKISQQAGWSPPLPTRHFQFSANNHKRASCKKVHKIPYMGLF